MTSDVNNRTCNLKALRSCNVREPFLGLQQNSPQSLQLDRDFFHCCMGKGQQLVGDELYVCKLQKRKSKLQALFRNFKSLWGEGYDQFWQRKLQIVDVRKLTARAQGEQRCRGRMLVSAKASRSPSYLWLVAAAAVWRFGVHVHFISIMSKSHDNFIPTRLENNAVVMVENHLATLHPENIVDCETIISYCYNTDTPLWIDFAGETKNKKPNLHLNFQVQEKLRLLQSKHPLLNFGKSGRDKLYDII